MPRAERWDWYKHFPQDFIRGALGLGPELIGALIIVLDQIYIDGESCPNDPRWLGGIMGCSTRKAQALISELLERGKLSLSTDGRLINGRAVFELESRANFHRKARESGAKGARALAENKTASNQNSHLTRATPEHLEENRIEKKESPPKDSSQALPLAEASKTQTPKQIQKEFDAFYLIFPRRVGRGDAERAYGRARKIATAENLLEGARRYAAARSGEDHKFTKHPATWLNAKGWLDEIPGLTPIAPPPVDLSTWVRRLKLFHHGDENCAVLEGYWNSSWGPPPTRAGCLVPEEAKAIFEGRAHA